MFKQACFSNDIFSLPTEQRLAQIRLIPKADLHAHMILSAPFQTLKRLSQKTIPHPPDRFASLLEFLEWLNQHVHVVISTPEKQQALLADCLDHMIADGVRYTELSFDIRLARTCSGEWSDLISRWDEEVRTRSHLIRVSPEIGVARELERSFVENELATIAKNPFFEGFDLYGAELSHPIESFDYLIAYAKDHHWRMKAHSGEVGSGEHLLHELQYAKPFAIQHGINAIQSSKALELLAQSKIQVNVCPWSNIYLSLVADYQAHPIRALYDAGVAVTIASDDYSIFGRSLSEEYCALFDNAIFNAEELENIRVNALRHYCLAEHSTHK